MLPHIPEAGIVDWQLEMFGKTLFNKTTVTNWMFAVFFGDYWHGSPTEITDRKVGDTGPGLIWKEARLHGVAYMDIDYSAKPVEVSRLTLLMERRLESLGKTRNKATAGEKGKRYGEGSETRPDGGGLLVRTGENDPHEYTIKQTDSESTDAAAVTYKFYGDSFKHMEARKARSEWIKEQRAELCGLGILWTQWLARQDADFVNALFTECKKKVRELVSTRAQEGGYTQVHIRASNALEDMLIGCLFFLTFLEQQADEIQGALDIYSYVEKQLDGFINDRLSAAHNLALAYQENRGGATQSESLARQIGKAIYYAVTHQNAHFENEAGQMPGSADMPAGKSAEPHAGYKEIRVESGEYQAGGVLLGVITPAYLYLSPQDLMPILEQRIKNCPARLVCCRALEEAKALVTKEDATRKYYTVRLERGGEHYFKVPTWLVYGDEEDEHQNTEHQEDTEQNTEIN